MNAIRDSYVLPIMLWAVLAATTATLVLADAPSRAPVAVTAWLGGLFTLALFQEARTRRVRRLRR